MIRYVSVIVIALGLVIVACEEEDDRTEGPASTTQQAALEAACTDLGNMGTVTEDATSAQEANGTLSGMFNNYNMIVSEALSAEAAEGVVQQQEEMACGEGTVNWEEGTVTYTDCYGLNGTIEWDGETYTIALEYSYPEGTAGYSGSFNYDGSITVTETNIDGNLHFDYQVAVGMEGYSFDYAIDMDITYDNIGLNAEGCPESGALDITADWAYNSNGEDYSFDVHFTAEFNSCGDTTVKY